MASRIKWRHQYDEAADAAAAAACEIRCEDESLAQQQFASDADLNVLVKRFGIRDAAMPLPAADARYYGDVSAVPDLRTALDLVRDATERFNALPAELRARFHNRPELLHEFVSDGRNLDECCRLGLLKRPEAPSEAPKAPPPGNAAVEA